MGSDSLFQIPVIDFSPFSSKLNRGTAGWHHLCEQVRNACEKYGCFEAIYNKISPRLRADTFSVVKELFTLPSETKKKNVNPKPYHGYYAGEYGKAPLYESFGVEDASDSDSMRGFLELMCPHGHDLFSSN